MKYILIFLALVGFLNASESTFKIVKKRVTGFGVSQTDAIYNALTEAIQQEYGVKIDSKKFFKTTQSEISTNTKDDYSFTEHNQNTILASTKGFVKSYKIISQGRTKDIGSYRVTILANLLKYKAPGLNPHDRRKIAILPLNSSKQYFVIKNQQKDRHEISQKITQEIISSLIQTRKFTVLDRESTFAYESEKNLLLSSDTPKEELVKLGKVLGTDYLFVGNIVDFKIEEKVEKIDISAKVSRSLVAEAIIQYRILVMATRQIKWSNTTTIKLNLTPSGSKEYDMTNFLKKLSNTITYEITNNIYPLNIVDTLANNQVIVGQGANTVKKGQIYTVYRKGKKLFSNYTGEFITRSQKRVGKIKITKVNPKISHAVVIEGKLRKNDICRIENSENKTHMDTGRTSNVKVLETGGVKLPFD